MSLFTDSMSLGFTAAEDVGGEYVDYDYSGTVECIYVVPGRVVGIQTNTGGRMQTAQRTLDFMIRRDRLVIDDIPREPQRGNIITRADGSSWKVTGPSSSEPVWRYSDSSLSYYRVQTVEHTSALEGLE
ncbi:MAG TPA: hypothetical protein DDW52_30435 [Planctomycetaceae bacterium]|nr:hypothetical protein [Planctomycetaceae bacterium]